jgi:GNAT superfamily N-acetyltransferase
MCFAPSLLIESGENGPMIEIKIIDSQDDKTAITIKVMHSLRKWFNPAEDIDRKSVVHRDYPFIAVYDDGSPIGFAALKIHNEFTADIYTIGLLEPYHRQGIGGKLILAAERYCAERGFLFLTVKTLDESAEYEPYERTRAFYRKAGFYPLEVFKTLWDEENPCLFMAKYLGE